MYVVYKGYQVPVSVSNKTSYRGVAQCIESARSGVKCSYHFKIWDRWNNSMYKTCGFETLRDLSKTGLIGYWNRALNSEHHKTCPIWRTPTPRRVCMRAFMNSPCFKLEPSLGWLTTVWHTLQMNEYSQDNSTTSKTAYWHLIRNFTFVNVNYILLDTDMVFIICKV